jgi:hypothetical protein
MALRGWLKGLTICNYLSYGRCPKFLRRNCVAGKTSNMTFTPNMTLMVGVFWDNSDDSLRYVVIQV